jgi:galactoside O-acetyltransferase
MSVNSFYQEQELQGLGFKKLGKNVLISKKASFYGASNMTIGDNVRIDDFCLLSGKVDIGNYIHIAAYAAIFGGSKGVTLQDFSTLSSRCTVYALTDDYSGASMTNPMVPDAFKNVSEVAVTIGRHVIVGAGSTILPGANVGEGVALGAHSLLTKPAEAWHIYAGAPAKMLKPRSRDLLEKEKQFYASLKGH